MQTQRTPRAAYGFADRGGSQPGMNADVNVIDLDALHSARAARWSSTCRPAADAWCSEVDGYLDTIKSGEVTFEDGDPTGARPGRVLRSGE